MARPERELSSAAALRQLEHTAAAAGLTLMQQAGNAVAHWIRQHYPPPASLLFAVGSGNNGGDAFIAAGLLLGEYRITVWQPVTVTSPQAMAAQQHYLASGGQIVATLDGMATPNLLIDGLFGAGLNRPLEQAWQARLAALHAMPCPRLALDVPSGLNAWTGCVQGAALPASDTLSLLCHKPGLFTADGRDYCGNVHLLPLDCPDAYRPPAAGELLAANLAPLQRRHNSNKGSFGCVTIVGGSSGMGGAALLAGRAALSLGAGKVRIRSLDPQLSLDPAWPELMIAGVDGNSLATATDVLAIGPGLGQSQQAAIAMHSALAHPGALVIDADALNLIASSPELQQQLRQRPRAAIITPHPAEAARLLGSHTLDIQQDRVQAVQQLAANLGVIALLKGAGSLVCQPDGYYRLCTAGNAALAAAGQGDVLTGSIAALIAQGLSDIDATCSAVWLHARSGDTYVAQSGGPIGLRASTSITLMRQDLNQQLACLHPPTLP